MITTLTSKGQLTLPASVRRKLKLRPGDKLDCVVRDDGRIEMIPMQRSIRDLRGILPRPTRRVSLKEMDDAIRRGAQD